MWVASINTDGSVTLSQPAFSDISGTISAGQLPSTLGATIFTGLITAEANIQLGVAGTTSDQIVFEGSTSGSRFITAPAIAGTSANPFSFSNSINIPSGTVFSINTDTGISRGSSGVIDIGNGTAGEDGPLGSGCQVFLYMIAAGNPTTFFVGNIDGTPAMLTISPGDIVRLEMFGNQLTFKINGSTVGTWTDNTYAHGKPTIKLFGDTQISDAQVSNFSGGSISSSPTGGQSPNIFGTDDYGPGINPAKTSTMGTNGRTRF
jgi:hypothetical protein